MNTLSKITDFIISETDEYIALNKPSGLLSIPDREYDAGHWWRYSEGVKEVLSEGAAYLYARFLFYPE
ncbi:MAG: hypothetical protein EOO05_20620 [Chitinophagaceae bacterium]|nr:MAG: hypothetical protein EOO05_20620 [Chitinophagaceae bacterium]